MRDETDLRSKRVKRASRVWWRCPKRLLSGMHCVRILICHALSQFNGGACRKMSHYFKELEQLKHSLSTKSPVFNKFTTKYKKRCRML